MVCRNGKERRGQAARRAFRRSRNRRGESPSSPPQAGCPAGGLTAAAGYGQEQRPINCGYCSILRDSSQTKGKQAAKFSEKKGAKRDSQGHFFLLYYIGNLQTENFAEE